MATTRNPTATLDEHECRRVRELLRDKGEAAARRLLGNVDARTLYKAASGVPVARLTASVLRERVEALGAATGERPRKVEP